MAVYGNTLKVIRHKISKMLYDLVLCTVSSGSETTAVLATTDPPLFYGREADYFNLNEYEVYCYEGTNIGVTRMVSDWASYTLTVSPAAASSYATSSKLELHKWFYVSELNSAINLAIDAAQHYLTDVKDETTIVLVETTGNDDTTLYTYEYTLPGSLMYIWRVTKEGYVGGKKLTGTVSGAFTLGEAISCSPSGATGVLSYGPSGGTYILIREISGTPAVGDTATGGTSSQTCSSITAVADETVGDGKFGMADIVNPRDWTIIPAYAAKIKFHENHFTVIDDLRVRLEGQGSQANVTSDTDNIFLPPNWITWKAITFLPFSKIESNGLLNTFKMAEKNSALTPVCFPYPGSKSVRE